MEQLEKEKYEKYNPNDIFKNKKQTISADENISNTVAMVEYKESIFKKIINKLKMKLFKNRNYEESLYKKYGMCCLILVYIKNKTFANYYNLRMFLM